MWSRRWLKIWLSMPGIDDRSAAALTAMDGGNAENAGAFFGPGGRRSHQSNSAPSFSSQYQLILSR
jgi:hypothetical protein